MTIAEIKATDVGINKLFNGITKEDIVAAVNNHLIKLKDDVLDETKKQAIVDAVKSGKVEELQLKLGMTKGAATLEHRADNMFGVKTLTNLKAGKVVETSGRGGEGKKREDGSKTEVYSPSAQLTLTKDQYQELLKPENATKLSGTKESLLYPLRTLIVTVSKDFRGDIKTDTLTFDFGVDFIKDMTTANDAFRKAQTIINVSPEPSNVSKMYTFDGTKWNLKTGDVPNPAANNTAARTGEVLSSVGFLGYDDIEDYLDEELTEEVTEDEQLLVGPDKVTVLKDKEEYKFGDLHLAKNQAGNRVISMIDGPTYFRKKDRKKIPSTITFSGDNKPEDCLKLMAFINLIGIKFQGKETGTDELADVEKDNENGYNWFSDSNPFYATGGILYFSDAGSIDDYDLLKEENLSDMVSGVSLEQLAQLLTSRVDYKFD